MIPWRGLTARQLEAGDQFLATCPVEKIGGPAALVELCRVIHEAGEPDDQPSIPPIVESPDLTLSNMSSRCESLLIAARELVFSDLATKYETTDGNLSLSIHISVRSRRTTL